MSKAGSNQFKSDPESHFNNVNVHVTADIRNRWPGFDFRGKPKISEYGYLYIEAKYKVLGITLFYVFAADSFIDRDGIKHGASELIFNPNPKWPYRLSVRTTRSQREKLGSIPSKATNL